MPKPTTLPRWSTDGSNMTAPSSTQMDTGWTPSQDGVSDYDNWCKYWTYKWLEWLNAASFGDGTFDNITVNTLGTFLNITVTALSTLYRTVTTGSTCYTGIANVALSASVNNLDPSGVASMAGVHTVNVTPSASTWKITGILAGANGQEIDVVNVGTEYFKITDSISSPSLSANTIVFPDTYKVVTADVLVEAGGSVRLRYTTSDSKWHVLSTSGCLYQRYFVKPGFTGRPRPTTPYDIHSGGEYLEITGLGDIFYDVTLPAKARLDSWTFHIVKDTSPSVTLTGQLYNAPTNGSGAATIGSAGSSSAAAPGFISTVNANNIDLEIDTGPLVQYFVRLTISGVFGAATDKVRALILTVWVPI